MHVLISGSTGLIGSALVRSLQADGHAISRLSRTGGGAGMFDTAAVPACDAVVHLAGEPVAGRWTAAKKAAIRDSRVGGTRSLCDALARLETRPRVLACASAVGFYGDRGDEVLTEESPAGTGFLADVVREWEAAARPAVEAGIRAVLLRFGVVLSQAGGALAKMLTPFRMGLGGKIGSGRQYVSWISLDDTVRAIRFALDTESLCGPVNVTAPNAVTNADFARVLARRLGRPSLMPTPAFAVRAVFGEAADELLLASTRVQPARLLEDGFAFQHPTLEKALDAALRG
ncbi:MAG: TIGR01777 family oxidoreductase [Phycisphaerae bacterium]|nr:TIGR01777 family oxidoreductase [Phycisphaerae bacterium]